jgi:hypothetical protein
VGSNPTIRMRVGSVAWHNTQGFQPCTEGSNPSLRIESRKRPWWLHLAVNQTVGGSIPSLDVMAVLCSGSGGILSQNQPTLRVPLVREVVCRTTSSRFESCRGDYLAQVGARLNNCPQNSYPEGSTLPVGSSVALRGTWLDAMKKRTRLLSS